MRLVKIGPAAKMLGVTPTTLRTWDRKGKLPSIRHEARGTRFYTEEQLLRLALPKKPDAQPVPSILPAE